MRREDNLRDARGRGASNHLNKRTHTHLHVDHPCESHVPHNPPHVLRRRRARRHRLARRRRRRRKEAQPRGGGGKGAEREAEGGGGGFGNGDGGEGTGPAAEGDSLRAVGAVVCVCVCARDVCHRNRERLWRGGGVRELVRVQLFADRITRRRLMTGSLSPASCPASEPPVRLI